MIELSRRAAVVTGATGNLGAAVVRQLLAAGAHVALPVRDAAKGEALRSSLGESADRVLIAAADLADRGSMDAFVERVHREWGRLDLLANVAGGFALGAADDVAAQRALWDQNVLTAVTVTAACLPSMRARSYGRIVSVASTAALAGRAKAAGYAMSKGALVRWTESLAAETRDQGITANVVLPSTIDHPENRRAMPGADASRWPTPDEVAALILFLLSEQSSGVTGAAIPVTGRT